MKATVAIMDIPHLSELSREVPHAYFHACYEVLLDTEGKSAMELYLAVVSRSPGWINVLMALRNRVVSLIGLKNLGQLGAFDRSKPANAYRVGEHIGIFSVLHISEDEVVLGDADKHLDVKVSVCKLTNAGRSSVAVSTVVHVHNTLGKIYMLFVAPVHRVIAPALLAKAPR